MIEIFPFIPLFFGKREEVPTIPATINITINNQTEYDIDYMLNDISTLTVQNNTTVVLDNLGPGTELKISGKEEKIINVEISGENTNETHQVVDVDVFPIEVSEDVTITITDYVEEVPTLPQDPTINITINNQTEYDIDYMLNDISTLTVQNNTTVVLDNLGPGTELKISGKEEKFINVEISGENINEIYHKISNHNSVIKVINEDVIITITDYVVEVEEGGDE